MTGIFLLTIGLISAVSICIKIYRLMRWHILIVAELYEFYDGVDNYNVPPEKFNFERNINFGKHRITLVGEGQHIFIGANFRYE